MQLIKIITYFIFLFILPQSAFALTGIYTAFEAGWANQIGLPDKETARADDLKIYNFPVGRLSVGYIHDFDFLPVIGMGFEAGVGYYGKDTYDYKYLETREMKSSTAEFLAVLISHIKQVDLFGKIGGIRHTITGVNKSDKSDKSAIQSEIIIGAAYNFNDHFAITTSYLHTFGQAINDLTNVDAECPSINAVLGGLRFTFW